MQPLTPNPSFNADAHRARLAAIAGLLVSLRVKNA